MKKNTFLYGTIILILVNFIVRFLGFSYKVILSRIIGPEAIGLFHLVFPILMVLITFTSAGIPVAVSKLVAHYLSLNNKRGCNRVLGLSLLLGLLMSILLSFLLFCYAKYISNSIIRNKDSYISLLGLIPAIPMITLSSIFRGYYYGIKNVSPPGISQIIEQIFRILFVLGSLYLLNPLEPKYAAFIAVIGISFGEFMGLLFLVFQFKIKEALYLSKTYYILREGKRNILGKIFYISIPITLTRLIGVIMQSINAVLIPQRLQVAGYTAQEALSIFGKLTGMALPILFLPFIVTSALVVNIIPTVSEEMALKNWNDIRLKSDLAIRMTLLVSIPTTALFIFFATPLCDFIYDQSEVARYLSLLAYGTIFLSLYHTVSGILHGMGKQIYTTIFYLLGMILQLLCTYYLVSDPNFGPIGFIIGHLLSTLILCILNIICLNYYIKIEINIINTILKPIFATIIMILFIINSYKICIYVDWKPMIGLFLSMMGGLLSYILIILLSGCIQFKTLKYIFTNK